MARHFLLSAAARTLSLAKVPRKTEAGYLIYVANKDLEEPIIDSETPGPWGGWIKLANGWTLELPAMAADTRLPITIEAKKLA